MTHILETYSNYVNWWPTWYTVWAPFIIVGCGYAIVWGWNDWHMFNTKFYRNRIIVALVCLPFCLTMLWIIPFLYFIIQAIRHWHVSEIEQIHRYEARRSDG
jgi:hypothetical protein